MRSRLRRSVIRLAALAVLGCVGCYGHVGPTIGYTFDRGFSGGAEGAAGLGVLGLRTGATWRPLEAGSESVWFGAFEASFGGIASLGVGMGYAESASWLFTVDGYPGALYHAATGTVLRDGSPVGFQLTDRVGLYLFTGLRYIAGAWEIYGSPQLYRFGPLP